MPLELSHLDMASNDALVLGCFYLAEGIIDNASNVMHVLRIWHPPIRSLSLGGFRIQNFFGGDVTADDRRKLIEMEQKPEFAKQFFVPKKKWKISNQVPLLNNGV